MASAGVGDGGMGRVCAAASARVRDREAVAEPIPLSSPSSRIVGSDAASDGASDVVNTVNLMEDDPGLSTRIFIVAVL